MISLLYLIEKNWNGNIFTFFSYSNSLFDIFHGELVKPGTYQIFQRLHEYNVNLQIDNLKLNWKNLIPIWSFRVWKKCICTTTSTICNFYFSFSKYFTANIVRSTGCFRSKYINSKWLHLWLLNVAFLLKPILKSQNKNYFLNFNLETLYCKLVSKYLSI